MQERTNTDDLTGSLSQVLTEYLEKRPYMSLSAIGRRCQVSEPTLRRIKNKQFRTAPTYTTVLNLLIYLSGIHSIPDLIRHYEGPIADYLQESLPQQKTHDIAYDYELNELLKDNTTYGVFKLSANSSGLSHQRAKRLFGDYGLQCLKKLEKLGYIEESEGVFRSKVEWFMLDIEQFSQKFQFLADFIKPKEHPRDPYLRSLQASYSCSLNEEAYRSIAKLQSKFLKKVREIMDAKESEGPIPMMLLQALDSFDTKSVDENFFVD